MGDLRQLSVSPCKNLGHGPVLITLGISFLSVRFVDQYIAADRQGRLGGWRVAGSGANVGKRSKRPPANSLSAGPARDVIEEIRNPSVTT